MKNSFINLGGNQLDEKGLCALIIRQLSRGNEKVKNNMINYHMREIKNVSEMLVSALGGHVVGAREFNAYFYETVNKLGYSTSQLTTPNTESMGRTIHF